MVEIPEDLLRRSAEAKAKALGVPVEQVLAEMKGEGPPVDVPAKEDPAEASDKPEPKELVVEALEGAPEQPEEEAVEPDEAEGAEPAEEAPAAAVIPEDEQPAAEAVKRR